MHKISILSAIFQGIPEAASLVFFSLVFLKASLKWNIILTISVIHTTVVFLIRFLNFAFGVHTLLSIIILSSFIVLFTKINAFRVITAVLISFTLLLAFEFTAFKSFMFLLNLSLEEILANPTLRILMGMPQVFFMFLTGMIVMFIRKA